MNEKVVRSWRDDPATGKQLSLISKMRWMSFDDFLLPKFDGKTKGEASDYIDKYRTVLDRRDPWLSEEECY